MESTGFPAPCTSNSFLLFFTLRVIHDPGQSFGVHIWFLKTWQHPAYQGLPKMQVLTQWLWGVTRNPVLVASFSRQGLSLHPEKGLSDVMAADSLQLQRAP